MSLNIVSDSRFLPISPSVIHFPPVLCFQKQLFDARPQGFGYPYRCVYIRDNLPPLDRADRRLCDSAPLRKLFLIHPHFFTFLSNFVFHR